MSDIVHKNYMRVRELRPWLKEWIDRRVQAVIDGEVADPEGTFVYYWLKNGGERDFRRKDIVFECFHNFLAFSQWGNTLYNIMARLAAGHGDPGVRSWFERTMADGPDETDGGAFTPLDRFVMELFRTISPNAGSLSTAPAARSATSRGQPSSPPTCRRAETRGYWPTRTEFDPDRYKVAPTSVDNDEARTKEAGLARCPFPPAPFAVNDGRRAEVTNSAFGAVYGVVDGTAYPVCDTAGYAPFGFGYRRCAGEQLTVEFVKEFFERSGEQDHVRQTRLSMLREQVPVNPGTVLNDDVAFTFR